MARTFTVLLVLNFLVETMAAASLILAPGGIRSPGLGEQWSMHYGFAALTIASIGIWVWRVRFQPAVVTLTLGILMTFHTAILISLSVAGDQSVGVSIHAFMAALSIFLFTQRSKILEVQS